MDPINSQFSPAPAPPRSSGLLIGILIGVILATAVGAGAWWYKMTMMRGSDYTVPPVVTPAPVPTPPAPADLTAGWQTYRSEEFGFEFKYPNGMNVIEVGAPFPGGAAIFVERNDDAASRMFSISVVPADHPNSLNDQQLFREGVSVDLNGISAIKFNNSFGIKTPNQTFVLSDFRDFETPASQPRADFLQILSTFRFI